MGEVEAEIDVMFVCTGNLCRSPSAAAFFERSVRQSQSQSQTQSQTQSQKEHGQNHAEIQKVTVQSLGIMGSTSEVPPRLVKEGAAFGLDFGDHVSRRISVGTIRRADLIVTMAREHVREIVLAQNDAFTKTFTLREIVRRGQDKGPRQPGDSLHTWLQRLNAGRRHLDLIGDSPDDDIQDPMGGRSEQFRNMLIEVEGLTRSLHALIWPEA